MPNRSRGRDLTIDDWVRHAEEQEQAAQAALEEDNSRFSRITTTVEQGETAPLEQFVDRCLRAAREDLQRLDPSFVAGVETQSRLEKAGLESYDHELETGPTVRLSKHWHELLVACHDLADHFWNVRIAASELDPSNFNGLAPDDASRRGTCYTRALSIFIQALLEHVVYVAECVTNAYLPAASKEQRKRVRLPYTKRAKEAFRTITESRNKHLHAGKRNAFADFVTEMELWEFVVVAGDGNHFQPSPLTARAAERHASNFRLGKWNHLKKAADYGCDLLGQVLLDLEEELAQRSSTRYEAPSA